MEEIISEYFLNYHHSTVQEQDFFVSRKSIIEAISYAALARDDEAKYSHQYRVNNEALKNSQSILLSRVEDIRKCTSFHTLFELIESLILPIHGIGPLTVYDTALRIGIKLGLHPEYIYLHAGTTEGARNLGLPTDAKYLRFDQLPKELRKLTPDQIESIFCIFKDKFKNPITKTKSRC